MARYGVDFADHIRDPRPPRPFAHIRPPHQLPRHGGSRQHSRDRDRDRDRNNPGRRIADGVHAVLVERQAVTDLADDFPERPINVNFNYGPVHIHQNCSCPGGGSAHICAAPHPNNSFYDLPARSRGPRPPPPPPLRLPRPLRGAARSPSPGVASGTRTTVIVRSPDSDSDSDFPSPGPGPGSHVRRSGRRPVSGGGGGMGGGMGVGVGVVGMCEGCLTRQRLVDGWFCADCEFFAAPAHIPPNAVPRERDRLTGAWNANGVRYVPRNGEPLARREGRGRERAREIEREIRQREREREIEREIRERERERERARARGATVENYSGRTRERRYYTGGGYYSDSDGESVW